MRLPVNFLLYVASIAMLGWAGLLFVEATFQEPEGAEAGGPSKLGFDIARDRIDQGRGLDSEEQGWNLANKKWWEQFREVNLTGKLPPEPVQEVSRIDETPPPEAEKPLDEIFHLLSLMHHNVQDGTESHVVIRYREGLDVQIPDPPKRAATAVTPPVANQVPPGQQPRPRGARPRPMTPPPPSMVRDLLMHHVQLGESLWPPFSHIKLVRVAEDARSAFFLRTAGEEETQPEEVFKNEMDLDPELVRKLVEDQRNPNLARNSERRSPRRVSSWLDVPETKQVTPGKFSISRSDNELIRENPQELLNRVTLRPYRSSTGDRSRNGVQLLQVDQNLGRRFGVRSGDVILEVNGIPVTSRSQAIDVGTKQYKQGVREFRVRMMTMGRIEERVYNAPPDG